MLRMKVNESSSLQTRSLAVVHKHMPDFQLSKDDCSVVLWEARNIPLHPSSP